MKYYLYNSKANNGIKPNVPAGTELIDAVGMDYPEYLKGLTPDDEVVLVGGDGTLNYFINAVKGVEIKNNIFELILRAKSRQIIWEGITPKSEITHILVCRDNILTCSVLVPFTHRSGVSSAIP